MSIRIGIPTPTSTNPQYNRLCWPQYAEAIHQAGATPIEIALGGSEGELLSAAASVDGFILPGSLADVDPAGYGELPRSGTAPADLAREQCDRELLAYASAHGRPVLAICFGAQFLNVWRGGSLVQDLSPVPVNHAAGNQVAVAHSVLVERESLLAALLTGAEAPPTAAGTRRLPVNSSHHQAVARPADDLAVVARSAEDNTIEALEGRIGEAAMIGVQWHPERSIGLSAASRALFTWLVSEATDRHQTLTLEGAVGAGH